MVQEHHPAVESDLTVAAIFVGFVPDVQRSGLLDSQLSFKFSSLF